MDVGTRDSAFSIGFIRYSTQPCFASRSPILHVVTHSASNGETLFFHWFYKGFHAEMHVPEGGEPAVRQSPFVTKACFPNGFQGFRPTVLGSWGGFFWPRGFACFPKVFEAFLRRLFFGQPTWGNPMNCKLFSCYIYLVLFR